MRAVLLTLLGACALPSFSADLGVLPDANRVHVSEAPFVVEKPEQVHPAPIVPPTPEVADLRSDPIRNLEELLTWPAPESASPTRPSQSFQAPAPPIASTNTPSLLRRVAASPFSFAAHCVAPARFVSSRAHDAVRGALRGVRDTGTRVVNMTDSAIDRSLACVQCVCVDTQVKIEGR